MIAARSLRRDDGFLALDAMIGLLVVSLGMAAVIEAQAAAQRLERSAVEFRQGAAEAQFRIDSEWPGLGRPGEISGSGGDYAWRLSASAEPSGLRSPLALCQVRSEVRFQGSRKVVAISTRRLCASGPRE
jgi:hypothetical protein